MKIPLSPPSPESLFENINDSEQLFKITQNASITDKDGRYLHWDELRFKEPPEGLNTKEWWLGTHIARRSAAQHLSFEDKTEKKFFYTEPPELKALMRYVDMNAGGLLGGGQHAIGAKDGRNYMRRSLAEEPFSSSLIEGAVTTRDIAKKMIFDNRPPKTKDERMVLNNYNGMLFIKERQHDRLTPAIILELHHIMTDGTLDDPEKAGQLRTQDDNINVVDDSTGEVLHQPPHADTLEERLENLCEFANNTDENTSYYFHPLLRAIMLHFMLAYDHPFVDGNGRTARALFYWLLIKEGYWLMEYTSISSVIADAPTAYYKSFLFVETDSGDLTYFFLHQARTTRKALERMHEYADEKRKEFERFNKIVNEQKLKSPLNERQILLIQDFSLKREKRMEIGIYKKRHVISYLTARNDLEDLTSRGLVRKTKEGRSSIYRPITGLSEKISAG